MPHKEPIRNSALAAALVQAGAGRVDPLFAVLARLSGLPGPCPNWHLAEAVGNHVAAMGSSTATILAALCRPAKEHEVYPAAPFFQICGAMTLSALELQRKRQCESSPDQQHAGPSVSGACAVGVSALDELRELAEDTRLLVREGVVRALVNVGRVLGDACAADLTGWMTAYMPASVAIEAIGQRPVLDRIRRGASVVALLDRAFELAELAPRADQRSQGFRLLVRALSEVPTSCMARFPDEIRVWLEQRASVQHPDLRGCIEGVLERAHREGRPARDVQSVAQKLSESARPLRDPRSYVGPTRRRGSRSRGR